MRLLSGVTSGVAEGLLPIVLDAAMKSIVILAMAGTVVLCCRRASAASRHWVWFLAMASLFLLPMLSFALPRWQILPHWIGDAGISTALESTEVFAPTRQRYEIGDSRSLENSEAVQPIESYLAVTAGDIFQSPAGNSTVTQTTDWRRLGFASWGLFAWLSGTLLALMPALLGTISLWYLGWSSTRITDSNSIQLTRHLLARLGICRTVFLLKSSRRRMPMTWGFLRPKLLLPNEAEDWPEERRRMVLLHELAHIKRWDYLTNLIAEIICAFYWFNPMVWVVAWYMRSERERACDDMVLSQGTRPADYAEQILQITAGLGADGLAAFGAVAMSRESTLEGRLLAILDPRRNRHAVNRWVVLSSALLVMAVLFPLAMMRAAESPAEDSSACKRERCPNNSA